MTLRVDVVETDLPVRLFGIFTISSRPVTYIVVPTCDGENILGRAERDLADRVGRRLDQLHVLLDGCRAEE